MSYSDFHRFEPHFDSSLILSASNVLEVSKVMILSVPIIPAPHVSLSRAQMSNITISLNSDLT